MKKSTRLFNIGPKHNQKHGKKPYYVGFSKHGKGFGGFGHSASGVLGRKKK